ncbi:MAG TPA: OmpA family protein [Stellaceae bacterium]|nr:OmpA family protein [Stellaceae bacterium]
MRLMLVLPAMGLFALAATGCGGNPTPATAEAGGPPVAANVVRVAAGSLSEVPATTEGAGSTQPPAREFTVYFPFNKSTLSPEAHSVIAEAASTAKQGQMTHIVVTGHTDTVGSEQYNQSLSDRRADAVRKAILAEGVADDSIAAKGVGKSDLAVPTADGVKEPRNRRVVITEGGPGV